MSTASTGPGAPVAGHVGPAGGGNRRLWPGGPPRRALALLVLAAAAIAVILVVTLGGSGTPAAHLDNGAPVSYTTVARETVTSQSDQSGTLGYSGSYTVSIPTGTQGSVLTQDLGAVQQDEAKVAGDERALAAARKLAGPQNADTLSAAQATVATDKTGLAEARARLAADEQLGCPASSSSTTTTPLSGSGTPSSGSGTPSSGSGTPSSGTGSPSSGTGSPTASRAALAHAAQGTTGGSGTPSGPSAQTGAVDGTSSSGTALTGTVTPGATDTTYYFEYGTSSAFGQTTPTQDAGSGTNPVAVSASLSGLTPGTAYDYRLVATSSQGTSYGQESTFTTTAGPQVTTGSAPAQTTTATFTGTVVPGGLNTSYYFAYGTTSVLGSKTPVQTANADSGSVSVSTTVTGLKPDTTYLFELVASNSLGSSSGQAASFQTLQSSCAAQAAVVREDEQAVAQAKDALAADKLSGGSSTSQDQAQLTSDQQALASAQQAYGQAQEQATNPGVRFTWLPSGGAVIHRGEAVYDLDGEPVPLFYGNVIPYRALEQGVTPGPDVTQLNQNLVALGYETGPASDAFTAQTAAAVRAWQKANGFAQTGVVSLGDVAIAPGALRITTIQAQDGAAVQPGAPVLQASALARQVVVQLDAALQSEVAVGDPVTITLPDNSTTPGRISYVGKVASSASSAGGDGGSPTINVYITPTDPAATGTLSDAPVTVAITVGTAPNALVVPVASLLALANGGYAIEEVLPNGTHQLQAVSTGLFDDANGMVQITGAGVEVGERIVTASQ